jgi:peptidoglycan/xylan/chitin deacetylase (PgdA/CDA1 family)
MSTKAKKRGWRRAWIGIGAVAVVAAAAAGVALAGVRLGGSHATVSAVPAATQPVTAPSSTTVPSTTPTTPVTTPITPPPRPDPSVAEIHRLVVAHAALREGSAKGRVVALTFDDGPSIYTARLVSELRRLHVPATFFEIGAQIPRYHALVAKMVKWGFVIGDHSWSHPDLQLLPNRTVMNQLLWTKNKIAKYTGEPVQLFRPPYGAQDARVRSLASRMGMVTTLWSIDTGDWRRPGTGAIVSAAIRALPGQIILMHDGGGDRTESLAAVPTIVRDLRARGYHFVTVPELLAIAPPSRRQLAGGARVVSRGG